MTTSRTLLLGYKPHCETKQASKFRLFEGKYDHVCTHVFGFEAARSYRLLSAGEKMFVMPQKRAVEDKYAAQSNQKTCDLVVLG